MVEGDYLLPLVKKMLNEKTSEERIRFIENNCWIGYPRALDAMKKLESLYHHPICHRMPNLLIIGPTNNGKTMIIENFNRKYPAIKNEKINPLGDHLVELPILSIQMPSGPDLKRFYLALLEKINFGAYYLRSRLQEMEAIFFEMVRKRKVKMIIIDEIHNLLAGSNKQQIQFLNLLRYIGNELRIPLTCVGTRDAYFAIRSDPQLENRFEPFLLPTWQLGEEYDSLLASFVTILPLKKRSELNNPDIASYILVKSEGFIGEIATLIRRAAVYAIRSGAEEINDQILKNIDYYSPKERQRLVEKEVMI